MAQDANYDANGVFQSSEVVLEAAAKQYAIKFKVPDGYTKWEFNGVKYDPDQVVDITQIAQNGVVTFTASDPAAAQP